MDAREARGRVLAQAHGDRIRQVDGERDVWYVPSSSPEAGGYLICGGRCSCPDENPRCKHVVAVEYVRGALVKADATAVMATAPTPARIPLRGDLTVEEQRHVRAAMKFLRTRSGGWKALAKGIRSTDKALELMAYSNPPNASLALRLARFSGASVEDIITGRFPPSGACPHCGHVPPSDTTG